MLENTSTINQMDESQILQMIQKNNEQIIQMLQQIFQVQMINNTLLNQIFINNLNNNISNNNKFNDMMNQMNKFMNNINMMNNQNMQNMAINNKMNIMNNNNVIDPWEGNTAHRINIILEYYNGYDTKRFTLHTPENITLKELIEGFKKKYNYENQDIYCVGYMFKDYEKK